jgi:tRNA modification GTPase
MIVMPAPSITATRLTAAGRGAVATIVLSCNSEAGTAALAASPFVAVNAQSLSQQTVNRVVFGKWGAAPGEEVVVCRTSDSEWEIHCHGGFAATERILGDLRNAGATVIDWDERVQRQQGLLVRECGVALSKATTTRAALLLLAQENVWRNWATEFSRIMHLGERHQAAEVIQGILRWSDFGRHLFEPFRVVLTGKPNVGKSSLINALVGFQRSIVFDQPGTTRDVVTAETAWDGWPVLLADTAGIRLNATGLEASGIQLAREQIAQADLVLVVRDASERPEAEADWNPAFMAALPDHEIRTFAISNKIDLNPAGQTESLPTEFAVSALTGEGLERLISELGRRLVPALPESEAPIPFSPNLIDWLRHLDTLVSSSSGTLEVDAHLDRLLAAAV